MYNRKNKFLFSYSIDKYSKDKVHSIDNDNFFRSIFRLWIYMTKKNEKKKKKSKKKGI